MIQEECLYNLDSFCPRLERLSPREKARAASGIMDQVLKGTRDLERNGITHRDIKLKKICFGKDGYWKIIDFGLARGLDENGDRPKASERAVSCLLKTADRSTMYSAAQWCGTGS